MYSLCGCIQLGDAQTILEGVSSCSAYGTTHHTPPACCQALPRLLITQYGFSLMEFPGSSTFPADSSLAVPLHNGDSQTQDGPPLSEGSGASMRLHPLAHLLLPLHHQTVILTQTRTSSCIILECLPPETTCLDLQM